MDEKGSIESTLFSMVGRSWIKRNDLKVHDPMIWTMKKSWSGSKFPSIFFDLDQMREYLFLVWTKKRVSFFNLDQNIDFFFIWIKNWLFASGSKNQFLFFDLDQKSAL